MKIMVALFILFHGLIHFLGFIKSLNAAAISQLKQTISLPAGILWLICGLLFIISAILIYLNHLSWWIAGLTAVLISQVIILYSWSDAKYGTIANVLIFIIVVAGAGMWKFQRSFQKDYETALAGSTIRHDKILPDSGIASLPLPVQRYLRYTGVLNKPEISNVRITMTGKMREKGKDWFPVSSEQYNFFETPTRLFYMTGIFSKIPVPGYHAYKNGIASMQVRLFGLIPVVNLSNRELNQAETVTMFNDMCLLAPASLIDERVQWVESDSLSATARFSCNGITVSARLIFNQEGQLINFISDDRYALSGKTMNKLRFSTPVSKYKDFGGYRLPGVGSAIWHYPDGEFEYARFNILSVEYNVANDLKE